MLESFISLLADSAMGNKDVKNFRTVKNTEYSDFLEKEGQPLQIQNFSIKVSLLFG